jgi:hypothetical protein
MSTIVVDVGCAKHGGDESIPDLVREFGPSELWGFDPAARDMAYMIDDTTVIESTYVAWKFDGKIGFKIAGLGGHVTSSEPAATPCIDLARWINEMSLEPTDRLIVKLDCEGAEYDLVPHLVERDADLRIDLMLIEWHCEGCGYGIWNWDDPHPDGCRADQAEWRERRERINAMLRCDSRGWSQ